MGPPCARPRVLAWRHRQGGARTWDGRLSGVVVWGLLFERAPGAEYGHVEADRLITIWVHKDVPLTSLIDSACTINIQQSHRSSIVMTVSDHDRLPLISSHMHSQLVSIIAYSIPRMSLHNREVLAPGQCP